MKPLLSTKVQRKDSGAPEVKEWERAEHHMTHDGKNEFHARMLARIKAAAQSTQSKPANVATLNYNRKGVKL